MANLVIGAKTFSPLSSSTSSGTIAVAGDYWYGTVLVGEKKYDRRRIPYPGIPGFDVKDYSSRGKTFAAQVLFISTTPTAVVARMNTMRVAFAGAQSDITTPEGETLTNCELDSFPSGIIYPLLDGKFLLMTTISMSEME